MTEIERKAALALFPYFSKEPVIIDGGSNKGDWAEVLAANVSKITLFEPNTILRHYSQVRFRHLRNVFYIDAALSNQNGQAEFAFFEDEHDGLSNIIGNSKWDGLYPKHETVDAVRLDSFTCEPIDFLKLDVEGAEWLALDGARGLLKDKKIKFIQVEFGDHIEITGKTFIELRVLIESYGYRLFHFHTDKDLQIFLPVNGTSLKDLKSIGAENFYFMDHNFSENWNLEFIENTRGLKFDFVLEIGCFEGLTSRYICDNLLNPGGRMICLDPLTDEYLPHHKDNAMFVGQYDRFIRNTRGYPIELIRKQSIEAKAELFHYRFGLIYVDGDHREEAVYLDGKMAFDLCRVGGYILFDDYEGYDPGTKSGVDRFLTELPKGIFSIVKQGYQMMIQKHQNLD